MPARRSACASRRRCPASCCPKPSRWTSFSKNDDLMVVNKPAGMVVHPAAGHASGTLVHAALAHAPEMEGIGGEQRPGVVHRLDKDTSGLILLAKNDAAHRWLQDQFRLRQVEKVYLALVDGAPPTPTGASRRRSAAIPPRASRWRWCRQARAGRRSANTAPWRRFANHTLLEVHPHHRAHPPDPPAPGFIGCPVAGDTVYGQRKASLPLHSATSCTPPA